MNYRYSPVNQGADYSVSIGKEKDLSGSVGFSAGYSNASSASDANPSAGGPGASVSGSLSAGVHKSETVSANYPEAAMTFSYEGRLRKAMRGAAFPSGLSWRYDLLRPCNGNGECNALHLGYAGNLQDATKLSVVDFTPQHEWTWQVPSKYSRIYFQTPGTYDRENGGNGFETFFRAVTGKSKGYAHLVHVMIAPAQHVCDQRFDLWFRVPVSRPPLLAVDQRGLNTFPVGGGNQTINLASEYYWKVYEKPDWVTVAPSSGGPSRNDGEHKTSLTGWDGSVDLQVTVYKDKDFDEGSKNRSGTVKICATESLDGDCLPEKGMIDIDGVEVWMEREEVWFDVTQVPF